jgi:hypothetical protein
MAKLADPRNVVASGCGRRGSRGLICPLPPLSAWPASRANAELAVKRLRKELDGAPPMAMTATARSRVLRERRAHGKVVLTVVVGEDELAEIARAGYAEAASTDRKDREAAVTLFLSDTVWGLMQ